LSVKNSVELLDKLKKALTTKDHVIWVRNILYNATFGNYFSYIMTVSFIGGGNQSTWRKPLTCRKSLTNFITLCCIEYTSQWTRNS